MRTGLTDTVSVSELDLAEIETLCKMSDQCRKVADAALHARGAEKLDQLDRLVLRNLLWHLRRIWVATQTSIPARNSTPGKNGG